MSRKANNVLLGIAACLLVVGIIDFDQRAYSQTKVDAITQIKNLSSIPAGVSVTSLQRSTCTASTPPVPKIATPSSFSFTNTGTPNASVLSATATDSSGNIASGVVVAFTAPNNGASGVFSNNSFVISSVTNSVGVASAAFTTNSTPGTFTVTATAATIGTSCVGIQMMQMVLSNDAWAIHRVARHFC